MDYPIYYKKDNRWIKVNSEHDFIEVHLMHTMTKIYRSNSNAKFKIEEIFKPTTKEKFDLAFNNAMKIINQQ